MKLLSGLMICDTDYEFETVMRNLAEVRNAKVTTNDLSISVDYEPLDTEDEFELLKRWAEWID